MTVLPGRSMLDGDKYVGHMVRTMPGRNRMSGIFVIFKWKNGDDP
jgi:hypothetical protein